jgi:hypothetical protein
MQVCTGSHTQFTTHTWQTAYQARLGQETRPRRHQEQQVHMLIGGKFHPRGYLSHHLAAISMAAVYTDAVHIADGVVGLKQRSLAASDPTA